MAQKEEEYQKEVLHKMTTFLMEHAARVIQRMWRSILAARAEKKRVMPRLIVIKFEIIMCLYFTFCFSTAQKIGI